MRGNIELAVNTLNEAVLEEGFKKFAKIEDRGFRQFCETVKTSQDFFGICKNAHSPRSLEGLRKEPKFVFYKECAK